MPNTYFQFKQFLINQERSGMKVTTDGCLFGAWVANKIAASPPGWVLDIGAGTGLLSLMLAQVTESTEIEALEMNKNAHTEASNNFNQSLWSSRLKCTHSSLQEFASNKKYDLIICNPPFFKDNFKGQQVGKNQAIHSDHLPVEELINGVLKNINTTGNAYILYPEYEMTQFIIEAKKAGLFLNKLTLVRNKKEGQIFRMMGQFSSQESVVSKNEIIIRKRDQSYTDEFWNLLKEYYL
ncbi:MAG: tRNA1(Val) (adenine(37)-N6)-methyltransferase [Ekhidna sp.]